MPFHFSISLPFFSQDESAEGEEGIEGESGDLRGVPEEPRRQHRKVRRGRLLRVHAGSRRRKQRGLEVCGVQLSPEFSQEGGALIGELLECFCDSCNSK